MASEIINKGPITEEKQNTQALIDTELANAPMELKQRNEEIEKTLQFGVFEYNEVNVSWSPGMYMIFDCEEHEGPMDYQTFISQLLQEDFDEIPETIRSTLLNVASYNDEFEIKTSGNRKKTIQVIGNRVYNENGIITKDAGIVKDITKQKEQDEIVNKAINEFLRSNKELENFAYIASHDLQEPVRKISTFSGRLLSKITSKLDEEEMMYMKRIMSSAENMRMLIDNLLEYSRISRNKYEFTQVNLDFVFQQVITDLELVIEETGAKITVGKLPEIYASFTQMKQLLNNLINNAIKFRNAQVAPVIAVNCSVLGDSEKQQHKLAGDRKYYKIEIKDNGIGFEPEYASRIFQIFQRLNGKSEYPGSGIGLAICKKIVEQHHGVIFGESTLGEGARFVVILPEK